MGGFVTNALKKKVKQLHDGYVKLKDEKKCKRDGKQEDCDKSGVYKAEPLEELYEKLIFHSKSRRHSDTATSSTSSKVSLPIPCSSKDSSNTSPDNLLESMRDALENASPCSSLDSGISSTPPGVKKIKKLQFSSDSDEVHYIERNTFERRSYKEPHVNDQCAMAQLCKTKVFKVPSAEKVRIINQKSNEKADSSKSDTNAVNGLQEIPFRRLKIKQSIVSPKTYHATSKKIINHPAPNNFLGNFSKRSPQDTQTHISRTINNKEATSLSQTASKSLNKCNIGNEDLLAPLLSSPPEKPPRSAIDIKRTLPDSSPVNASANRSCIDCTDWTILSSDLKDSRMDEAGYSVPFDTTRNYIPGISSTPIKGQSTAPMEHLYAQITPRSSRDVEKILSPVASKIAKNKSDHIYAQVTPRSSRNIGQHYPLNEIISSSICEKTNLENSTKSETYFSCSQGLSLSDDKSTTENDILSKESKDKINMIHKTNWSLKMKDVIQEHECNVKNKKAEEQCLEEKFVVNMFQSRPSKRWEKHIRDMDVQKDGQPGKFDRNLWERLSLDSKKPKTRRLDKNIQSIAANLVDVEKEIEQLERESKSLDIMSKKIKLELKRMEQEDNEAYSKKLEQEKQRIENHLNKLNNNVDETTIKLTHKSRTIETELEKIKSQSTEDYNKYKKLKKFRDIQCTRMTQASKALEEIKNRKGKKDWLEVLVAEGTLLETSEQVKLLTQQIRDNTYTVIPEPPLHKGTIQLSNIKFPFTKQYRGITKREKHYTDFFVMTLSYGTQIFVSEFITGESDPLTFSRNHTFKNVKPDFEIKVQLFSLRLRTSEEYFWEKFAYMHLCPTSQIIYEDLLTHQFQEKTVYKTSFKLCAETVLTRTNIDEVSARLNTKPEVFCKLDDQIEFNLKCDDVDIVARLSGFLDLGTLCGETYFWERKWCVLDGPNLMLYNYPQEEDLGKPFEQINLEYCFGPIVTKVDNCPKRRSFHLKTGRPNAFMNQNIEDPHTLKTKPNFTLRKFYFAAGNMEDYLHWTVEVEKILNSLSDFKKLAFGEEYAEYLKQ